MAACRCRPLLAAFEVGGVFRIALPLVLRMLGIRAKRTSAARKGGTGSDDGLRRLALLHPVDDGAEQIEPLQRGATAAMAHSRHGKQAARLLANLVQAAGVPGHALVIVDRVERREPRIAPAVVKQDLATAAEEAR